MLQFLCIFLIVIKKGQCLVISSYLGQLRTKILVSNVHFRSCTSILFCSGAHDDKPCDPKFAAYFERDKKELSLKEMNYPIGYLAEMLKTGGLNLAPDYQRGFVWPKERSARLVETVLGGRFIPPVVLHKKQDNKFDVIDGKQRLSTILAFRMGPKEASKFGLPETAVRLQPERTDDGEDHPLKGLEFQHLSSVEQRNYNTFGVDVKIVDKDADEDSVFEIYEDINSGADDLSAQQLRRAAFNGDYMKMVDSLRSSHLFVTIRGEKEIDKKEGDGEAILRALALSHIKTQDFKPPLKKFLNRDASAMNKKLKDASEQRASEILENERKMFETICAIMIDVFGPDHVCREWYDGDWKAKFSVGMWEGLFVTIHDLLTSHDKLNRVAFQRQAAVIVKALQREFDSGNLDAAVMKATKVSLVKRISVLKKMMDAILLDEGSVVGSAVDETGKRLFFRDEDLIRDIWSRQGGTCTACGNAIHESRVLDGRYAHLDHIVPYSKGGKTEPTNCQLLHATCNSSKGAR